MAWPAAVAVAVARSSRALAPGLLAGTSPAFWKLLAASTYTPMAAA